MIRVCPKRDAVCPHGMKCPYVIDRYDCAPEPKPPSDALMAALGAVHRTPVSNNDMNTKSNLPIRQSPTGGA